MERDFGPLPPPQTNWSEADIEQAQEEWIDAARDHLEKLQQEERERKQARRGTEPSRLLRTPQAAKYLGLSEWALRQMVRDGEINCIRGKYWKFDRAALDAWIGKNQR